MGERIEQRRWARLRPEHHHSYPAHYHGHWFRVADRNHPDIPGDGDVWLAVAGGLQKAKATHFEITQRTRPRILVADDEASIRQTLEMVLSNAGYEVFQARDGEEACRLWREVGPDVLITDIHMPRKSGLLLMQELQESGSSTRVIAMTDGGPDRKLNLLGLAELLGAVRKVAKPFTVEEMMVALEQELRVDL